MFLVKLLLFHRGLTLDVSTFSEAIKDYLLLKISTDIQWILFSNKQINQLSKKFEQKFFI